MNNVTQLEEEFSTYSKFRQMVITKNGNYFIPA